MSTLGQAGITIQQLVDLSFMPSSSGVLLMTAQFVHRELPVRYAVRSMELELMEEWVKNSHFKEIQNIYSSTFASLRMCPHIANEKDVTRFEKVIADVQLQHARVIPLMAATVYAHKNEGRLEDPARAKYLNLMVDKLFAARVSSELLVAQLLAMCKDVLHPGPSHPPGWHGGALEIACNLDSVCRDAVKIATRHCEAQFGRAPPVKILGDNSLALPYFPHELRFILAELLSNAMSATMSKDSGPDGQSSVPAVKMVISGGAGEDSLLGVMVQDEGGGIPLDLCLKSKEYAYTSKSKEEQNKALVRMLEYVDKPKLREHETVEILPANMPFTGLGFGIPLAILYANHFGGELKFRSLEGYGTTAFLHLTKNANHAENIHSTRWHTRNDTYHIRCHNSGLVTARGF
eukprot:CAMPEP_0196581594 /NCGR_PEP_ID=MMETSP1081-20130531/34527_1 /TAXON_ID=36882 /ORGANISM="Pyramimonas amylifera, Strain CCMP720" /LENGTH=404 /DNA_ID=CAMNT_0041901885 /DNA_START=460 /DNA_END=1674 /DNA_ORIENTATION=+